MALLMVQYARLCSRMQKHTTFIRALAFLVINFGCKIVFHAQLVYDTDTMSFYRHMNYYNFQTSTQCLTGNHPVRVKTCQNKLTVRYYTHACPTGFVLSTQWTTCQGITYYNVSALAYHRNRIVVASISVF